MSGNIRNTTTAYSYAEKIGVSMGNYGGNSLGGVDEESTISANENCKSTFSCAQMMLNNFKEALGKDNGHIKTLAEEFEKFDNLMGEKNKALEG